jgi:hypothetical protein
MRSESCPPVAWLTDREVILPGLRWARLSADADRTGLQTVLASGLYADRRRPWETGEFGDPEDVASIDELDAARLLREWWEDDPGEEYEQDEQLRAMLGPFGPRFPGLAPAITTDIDSELTRRALGQFTRDERIALVPADRPADVLPLLGWQGACNSRTSSELAAILRSWEDRFGARLLEVGFADIRLLVARPPQTLEEALPIAAEHFVFSDEAGRCGLSDVPKIAAALVSNPFWDFWWD